MFNPVKGAFMIPGNHLKMIIEILIGLTVACIHQKGTSMQCIQFLFSWNDDDITLANSLNNFSAYLLIASSENESLSADRCDYDLALFSMNDFKDLAFAEVFSNQLIFIQLLIFSSTFRGSIYIKVYSSLHFIIILYYLNYIGMHIRQG